MVFFYVVLSVNQVLTTAQKPTFQLHKGAIYLGVDAWQSPNGFDIFGAVIYRLVDDGAGNFKSEATPLDFVQLSERHTGEYLASMVQCMVEKFGLEHWV